MRIDQGAGAVPVMSGSASDVEGVVGELDVGVGHPGPDGDGDGASSAASTSD
jgi:hypothetical protein